MWLAGAGWGLGRHGLQGSRRREGALIMRSSVRTGLRCFSPKSLDGVCSVAPMRSPRSPAPAVRRGRRGGTRPEGNYKRRAAADETKWFAY